MRASFALFGIVLLSAAQQAVAQDFFVRDRYQNVRERPQPAFDPQPLRIGSFLASPELGLRSLYLSNVFAAETGREDDFIFGIAPALRVRSDWGRHEIGFNGSLLRRQFVDFGSETTTAFSGAANGRLDLSSGFSISAEGRGGRFFEPRTSAEALPDAEAPIQLERFGGSVGANLTTGRLRISGDIDFDRLDFDDVGLASGGDADQDFRDRDEGRGRLRAAFAPSRDWAFFVQGRYEVIEHDLPSLIDGIERDNESYTIQAGFDFELPQLIRGDIAVGFVDTSFEDPLLTDVSGVAVDATFEWFITQLTTISARARRDVDASGIIGSAGREALGFGARVDHELRRNILIGLDFGYDQFDFIDIDRSDDRIQFEAGVTYKVNPRLHLSSNYRLDNQASSGAAADIDFLAHTVSFGLRIFP